MLRIRLARFGAKKKPTYRLVVVERTRDNQGTVLEYLGSYNPRSNPKNIQLEKERIEYWIKMGAQPTATVHNMLVSEKIIDAKKVKAWRPKKDPEAEKKKAEALKAEASKIETPKTEPVAKTPVEAPAETPAESVPAEEAPKE